MKSASHARRSRPIQQPVLKSLGFVLLCLLPTLGILRLAAQGSYWPFAVYLFGSLLVFALYLHDKRSALRGDWRMPEARLHMAELIGGWPGALLAQQLLRHKTRKLSYQLVFWLIVVTHQVAWLDYLYLQRLQGLLLRLPI